MLNKGKFSKRLKELRKMQGISTRSLAKAIGLKSHAAITQFEKGTSMPALDTLVALAGFFEVTLDYLVGMTDFPQAIPDKTKKLLEQTENPEACITILNQISNEKFQELQKRTESPQIIAEMIMGLDEKSMLELYMFLRYLHIRQALVETDAISADRI
ncbi:helix-turn-helix domain-containing protein [Syntrophomonas wolfei]|jgi:transcriptional regulator with XRE-family HTH domain|uniref:helix-turn-helix domain-containing protein n=1 Tax=Syntrophomonas wolfei TaxID=863 RepID=UPI0009E8326A|nr:helix-turn-helix transcriptional regulator [Syntrophomonas wolfei]